MKEEVAAKFFNSQASLIPERARSPQNRFNQTARRQQ
jgi:hypothetical protein